jgi:hypothetical protein
MAERINHSSIIVGRKGTGKSTTANNLAVEYARRTGKKALIIDVNGSPAYKDHPLLTTHQLKTWKPDANTRVARYYLQDHKEMFQAITDHFRNGFVVFEDCTKYIDPNPSRQIKTFLVDHRMWNVDMLFTFHSFKRVPNFFWEMTNYVIILKTQEEFETARNRSIIPNFEKVKEAREKVMKHKSDYYNLTVETLI